MTNVNKFTAKLHDGQIVAVGKALYAICDACGSVVKINKFLFGSSHVCCERPPEQELKEK